MSELFRPVRRDTEIAKLAVGRKHRLDFAIRDNGCGLHILLREGAPSRGARIRGQYSLRYDGGEVGLRAGVWPDLKLADALVAAWKLVPDLKAGSLRPKRLATRHERQQNQVSREVKTLNGVAKLFRASRVGATSGAWSANTTKCFDSRMRVHIAPLIGERDPLSLDTHDILSVLQRPTGEAQTPFWDCRKWQATFVRGDLETLLNYAYSLNEVTRPNPARWQGHLKNLLNDHTEVREAETESNQPIPLDQLQRFTAELRDTDTRPARCLEWQLLSAARPHMAREAHWEQIDLSRREWHLSGKEMKGKGAKDHTCPISQPMLEILLRLPHREGLLFPSATGKVMSHSYPRNLLRSLCPDADLHGTRTSFAVWCQQKVNGVPNALEVERETALAHVVGTKVSRTYARDDLLDARREVMDRWASFLAGPAARPRPAHTDMLQ